MRGRGSIPVNYLGSMLFTVPMFLPVVPMLFFGLFAYLMLRTFVLFFLLTLVW